MMWYISIPEFWDGMGLCQEATTHNNNSSPPN